MIWLPLLLIAALIPATIAARKGQSFLGFYVFGVLLWIVAVPYAIRAKDVRPRCPHCRELVQRDARVCPHCRSGLTPANPTPAVR